VTKYVSFIPSKMGKHTGAVDFIESCVHAYVVEFTGPDDRRHPVEANGCNTSQSDSEARESLRFPSRRRVQPVVEVPVRCALSAEALKNPLVARAAGIKTEEAEYMRLRRMIHLPPSVESHRSVSRSVSRVEVELDVHQYGTAAGCSEGTNGRAE
jgi:hypothetical protein